MTSSSKNCGITIGQIFLSARESVPQYSEQQKLRHNYRTNFSQCTRKCSLVQQRKARIKEKISRKRKLFYTLEIFEFMALKVKAVERKIKFCNDENAPGVYRYVIFPERFAYCLMKKRWVRRTKAFFQIMPSSWRFQRYSGNCSG